MELTKELILSVLERNSKRFEINGFTLAIVDKSDWGKVAKDLLDIHNFEKNKGEIIEAAKTLWAAGRKLDAARELMKVGYSLKEANDLREAGFNITPSTP